MQLASFSIANFRRAGLQSKRIGSCDNCELLTFFSQGSIYDEPHSRQGPGTERRQVIPEPHLLSSPQLSNQHCNKLGRYPGVFYPQMYLMQGGYNEFFTTQGGAYQVRCKLRAVTPPFSAWTLTGLDRICAPGGTPPCTPTPTCPSSRSVFACGRASAAGGPRCADPDPLRLSVRAGEQEHAAAEQGAAAPRGGGQPRGAPPARAPGSAPAHGARLTCPAGPGGGCKARPPLGRASTDRRRLKTTPAPGEEEEEPPAAQPTADRVGSDVTPADRIGSDVPPPPRRAARWRGRSIACAAPLARCERFFTTDLP